MTFSERLKAACEAAGFTSKDLADWCGVDASAVRQWIRLGALPHPVKRARLEQALALLNMFMQKQKEPWLPVPMGVTQFERKEYIEKVKAHALAAVSKNSTSKRGRI